MSQLSLILTIYLRKCSANEQAPNYMTTLHPYLYFNGNCEEAFNFYSFVFGTELKFIGRYKDMPQQDRSVFSAADDKVMHVSLPLSAGCDLIETNSRPIVASSYALYINADQKSEADRLFQQLSDGGQIKMRMTDTFWGSYYGMCIDKFGISWKISVDLQAE